MAPEDPGELAGGTDFSLGFVDASCPGERSEPDVERPDRFPGETGAGRFRERDVKEESMSNEPDGHTSISREGSETGEERALLGGACTSTVLPPCETDVWTGDLERA